MTQQNPIPPPEMPHLMLWFNLVWILMVIALILGIWASKIEFEKSDLSLTDYFVEHTNLYEQDLSFVNSSIPAQAPPYLVSGRVYGTISAYNPVWWQCDSTPDITASGKKVKEGYIANNCLPFGTIVVIDGKHYEVQDRMNSRYGCEYFDILMWNYQEAKEFGRQTKLIEYYK